MSNDIAIEIADLAHLVERRSCKADVVSSNPTIGTRFDYIQYVFNLIKENVKNFRPLLW